MKAILEDVACVALGVALFFGLPWLYTAAGLNPQYDAWCTEQGVAE